MEFEQLHCPMSYTVYKFQPELGDFSACCDARSYQVNPTLFEQLGDDYFVKHPVLIERKQALYDNVQHSDCEQCWIKESQGLQSMRMALGPEYHDIWGDRTIPTDVAMPARIELWMNSTCNLGCFMCHLGNSNTLRKIWYKDYDSYGNDGAGYELYLSKSDYQNYKQQFTDSMLKFVIENIKDKSRYNFNIAYLGGEPTLHHEMYDHADLFIEAGKDVVAHKELKIEITTNGTSKDKLNERFYKMYRRYKDAGWSTRIMLSQDSAGEFANVRHGADFAQIAKNYGTWISDSSPVDEVVSFTVVSALSLPYIDVMADYIDETIRRNYSGKKKLSIEFNTLISPNWMRVENLPIKYAEKSVKHAKEIFEKLDQDYDNLKYNGALFNNISGTLQETISSEKAIAFFERIDYTNAVYQKTYPNWNFYETFPFLKEYRTEYQI